MSESIHQQSRLYDRQSRNQEVQQAQAQAQDLGRNRGPMVDIGEGDPVELFEKLTDPDVESDIYEDVEDFLAPFLSRQEMLTSHDTGEYYDDLSNELLNANLADRIIAMMETPELCTGPFLQVAQQVEGERGGYKPRQLTPREKEAIRQIITHLKTHRQALGDGTLLEAIMEIHVSSEVRRDDDAGSDSSGSLWSKISPFSG